MENYSNQPSFQQKKKPTEGQPPMAKQSSLLAADLFKRVETKGQLNQTEEKGGAENVIFEAPAAQVKGIFAVEE